MSQQPQVPFERMVFRKPNSRLGRQYLRIARQQHHEAPRLRADYSERFTRRFPFRMTPMKPAWCACPAQWRSKLARRRVSSGPVRRALYSRDSQIELKTENQADIAEFSAEVGHRTLCSSSPIRLFQRIRHCDSTRAPPASTRDLNIILGKNVQAGRTPSRVPFSEPGNWTSWPPHEHAQSFEEMYVYFDMPEPAYGIQLVYNDTKYPELVTVVARRRRSINAQRLSPKRFGPRTPTRLLLWAMAAHREVEDRQFGVVNIQQAFQQSGSGWKQRENKTDLSK